MYLLPLVTNSPILFATNTERRESATWQVHTTLLNEYKFERRTARFQNVEYWDVFDADHEEAHGNDPDGYRLAYGGRGVTLEGHGRGIRILMNTSVDPRQFIDYLKGLTAHSGRTDQNPTVRKSLKTDYLSSNAMIESPLTKRNSSVAAVTANG